MGLDADGLVLAESKNKITSLVINQSWDRVVCKDIPHVIPIIFLYGITI